MLPENLNYYNYFTEVEETFIRRRGKNLFLSPLDWALIESWQERGIPLHIVIRSIESVFDVFDKQPAGTRTIKSLFYCREEIEVEYGEWLRSQTGRSVETAVDSSPMFTIEGVGDHIDRAIVALEAISMPEINEDVSRAIARLSEIRASLTDDLEAVDGSLGDVEKLLDRAMLSNWPPVHLKVIEKEIKGELKAYKAEMEPDAYKQTFEMMMLKRLRQEAGVPRLGLFYL